MVQAEDKFIQNESFEELKIPDNKLFAVNNDLKLQKL